MRDGRNVNVSQQNSNRTNKPLAAGQQQQQQGVIVRGGRGLEKAADKLKTSGGGAHARTADYVSCNSQHSVANSNTACLTASCFNNQRNAAAL